MKTGTLAYSLNIRFSPEMSGFDLPDRPKRILPSHKPDGQQRYFVSTSSFFSLG